MDVDPGLLRRLVKMRCELDRIIEEANGGEHNAIPAAPAVSSPQAIMQVMFDGGQPMNARQIFDELVRRNQAPGSARPMQAVRVVLSRLVQSGRVSRPDQGLYLLDIDRFKQEFPDYP